METHWDGRPPGAVPARLGKFVGRGAEYWHLRRLVDGGTPLITVSGLAGVGKTRLVQETLCRRVDGWISACCVTSADSLVAAVERLAHTESTLTGSDKQVVVIDSLNDAAIGPNLVRALDRFDQLQIVVTSQTRLNIRGEVVLRLQPLRYPASSSDVDVAHPDEWEAIECFVRTAERVNQCFALSSRNVADVVTLVQTAGGLPLAVELLACWVRAFDVAELVERVMYSLDPLAGGPLDLPDRQQDLRKSILATIRSMTQTDQQALEALARVGVVSWKGLCRGLNRQIPISAIARLVDHNLVELVEEQGSRRITMHPTVRRVVTDPSSRCTIQSGLPSRRDYPATPFGLSRREIEVLQKVTLGATDREIADQLYISFRTVNTHVSTILRKLGVERRRHAAAWARTNLTPA